MDFADWAALDTALDLADANADLAAAEAMLANLSPDAATDNDVPIEPADASGDEIYDLADDDDGDGLDDADDSDDGDGGGGGDE